jgi:hypothetical protein
MRGIGIPDAQIRQEFPLPIGERFGFSGLQPTIRIVIPGRLSFRRVGSGL